MKIIRKVNIISGIVKDSRESYLAVYDMVHESSHLNCSSFDETYAPLLTRRSSFSNENEGMLGDQSSSNDSEISIFNLDLSRHPNSGHNTQYLNIRRLLSLGSLSLRK